MKKERVDVLAVQQGLFETREKAKRGVMAGLVVMEKNNLRLDKPGEKIPADTALRVKGEVMPYVSRGGLKLAKALKEFDFTVQDKILLDIGASTGGFTDVALQNGTKMSYALDVGYNQLAWKLRQDPRVVVMERQNFRYSKPSDFTEGLPEVATMDVSFISLKLILPPLHEILVSGGFAMALVKPQFEAGKELVGKHGIVREATTHEKVLEDITAFALATGFDVKDLSFSPITGGEGNIEFLLLMQKAEETGTLAPGVDIHETVKKAHDSLT